MTTSAPTTCDLHTTRGGNVCGEPATGFVVGRAAPTWPVAGWGFCAKHRVALLRDLAGDSIEIMAVRRRQTPADAALAKTEIYFPTRARRLADERLAATMKRIHEAASRRAPRPPALG